MLPMLDRTFVLSLVFPAPNNVDGMFWENHFVLGFVAEKQSCRDVRDFVTIMVL